MTKTDKSLPKNKPFASKSITVQIDIYRNGARVMTLPSGFGKSKIEVIETENYQLTVRYT